jgi:hypothetical protein
LEGGLAAGGFPEPEPAEQPEKETVVIKTAHSQVLARTMSFFDELCMSSPEAQNRLNDAMRQI